jgi:hypothetical protein
MFQVAKRIASGRLLAALAGTMLATALFALWFASDLGGARATLWADDVATPLAAATAAVACLRAAARHGGRMRLFWSLLTAATVCWTLAEVVWGVYALVLSEEVPSPSWADVGYLGAIPLAVTALALHPGTRASGRRRARLVFDGAVVASALLFLSWTLVLGPLWRSTDLSTLGGVVTIAYPFGDILILFFVVLAIRGMTGSERLSLWCLLAALGAMALSDSSFTYLTEVSTYSSSSANVIDAGWIAAYLGIALAALASRGGAWTPQPDRSRPSLAALTAPLLTVLLALIVVAVQINLGHRPDRAAWLMAFGLVALVMVRQALALLEFFAAPHEDTLRLSERIAEAALGEAPRPYPARVPAER